MVYLMTFLTAAFLSGIRGGEYETIYAELTKENSKPTTWKMGLNPAFSSKSLKQISSFLGDLTLLREGTNGPLKTKIAEKIDLPTNFDARTHWPYCKYIGFIRDQSNCGSCWAVSSASVITDRHCIASNGFEQPYISDEQLLACCTSCGFGCNGGYPADAFEFWIDKGLVTGGPYGDRKSCMPYEIQPCEEPEGSAETPQCKEKCVEGYSIDKNDDTFHGNSYYHLKSNETLIRQEIYQNGPVEASFSVYMDFLYYISGIYTYTAGRYLGGHAVRIIGWGEENGVPYWLVTNSWGQTFGEHGIFRIKRGSNECFIETRVIGGIAKRRLPDVRVQQQKSLGYLSKPSQI
ncbi:Gut specific cysteine proteinase [Trichuris trichiura]|uniref:Gut specific cysteine proteinase n=1 Tax=Trichuris trichiura TaxID=36087 RepID=A0A077ZGY4_TRITR|nr:Gut specific cysteine proteinase [Trichuris trichiura]